MISKDNLTKLVKKGVDQVQFLQVLLGRAIGLIDYPVPANSKMRTTSSKTINHYYRSSFETFLPIWTCAKQLGIDFDEPRNILDFGCGVGRQLLHFTRYYPDGNYYACDVNDTSIDFIQKSYPSVKAQVSSFFPPLSYEDATFDLIYSVSVFSHLAPEDHRPWLEELARIVVPGGYCFLTIEGNNSISNLSGILETEQKYLHTQLMDSGYVYKEYEYLAESKQDENFLKSTSRALGIEGTYGSTLMSSDYVRHHWESEYFEVVSIVEGIIGFQQDLVILRRRQ